MPFNQQEQEIIDFGKANGKSPQDIIDAVSKFRSSPAPEGPSRFQETLEDIKQTGQNIVGRFETVADKIPEIKQADQGPVSTAVQTFGAGAGAVSQSVGDIFTGLVKGALSQEQENVVKGKVQEVTTSVIQSPVVTPIVKEYIEAYQNSTPEVQRNLEGIFNMAMLGLDIAGVGATARGVKAGRQAITEGVERGVKFGADVVADVAQKAKPIVETSLQKLERIPKRVSTNIETRKLAEGSIKELSTDTAQKAARDGIEIADIKVLTKIPKQQKGITKELFDRVKKYSGSKTGPRPEEVVGKPIVEALKKADSLRISVGKKLGEVSKNLGVVSKEELVAPVFNKLKSVPGLNELKLTEKGLLNFKNTTLASELTKADRVSIQKAFTNATRWGKGERLHRFRQELFEILGGKKKSLANITDTQEKAFQSIRSGLSDVLESKNSVYKALSKEYREIVEPLGNMRKFFKNVIGAEDDILEMNAGLLARRLTSNTKSGVEIKEILRSLDKALGANFAVSTENIQDIYNILARYYDISAPTGFRGQIEQGIKTSGGAFDFVKGKVSEFSGVTPEVRQKAIEDLLKKALK